MQGDARAPEGWWAPVRTAVLMLAVMTVLTGVAYPACVTTVARSAFAERAGGSLVHGQDGVVGSTLIGQAFSDPRYFWGRPSATPGFPYHAAESAASNLGPNNPALRAAVLDRIRALRAADPEATEPVPVDLVTSSASGLDPHISPAAALYQVRRVAKARGASVPSIVALVQASTEEPTWGLLGEPRVNVLLLNLELDRTDLSSR